MSNRITPYSPVFDIIEDVGPSVLRSQGWDVPRFDIDRSQSMRSNNSVALNGNVLRDGEYGKLLSATYGSDTEGNNETVEIVVRFGQEYARNYITVTESIVSSTTARLCHPGSL